MPRLNNYRKSVANKNDELYTPKILVEPILEYIPENSKIWCPFDTSSSEFVIALKERGFSVTHSHLCTGQDFFNYQPDSFDIVVSNPPFSLKLEVFERLFSFGKPFAVVMGLPILNYQNVGEFFFKMQGDGKNLQLLIVDKKVSFDGNTASFNNSYFCWNLLPKDLLFAHLEHNNSRSYFTQSRMKLC